MLSNSAITEHISFLIVFLEGVFSFFSPCIIPLIPVYMSYLSGSAKTTLDDGTIIYNQKKTFFHTIFFTLGICSTFFILGLSFSVIGRFFGSHQYLFTKIGGILIILLGLFQIGFLDFKFLQREKKFHLDLSKREANPFVAFIMGFTFSFAWTPCVGPALSSVLILASSSKSGLTSSVLILTYSLGFIIPFLILGIFTSKVLNFFKKYQRFIKYSVKISGVLLIVIGIMTYTGYVNTISSYLNSFVNTNVDTIENGKYTTDDKDNANNEDESKKDDKNKNNKDKFTENEDNKDNKQDLIDAFNFTMVDQYGNTHTLSDYKGKVIFLNFWATWCSPCLKEMPDIETLYKEYGLNKKDVIILGVASPKTEQNPYGADVPKDEILDFIEEHGYTFPILFDETGSVVRDYMIRAFPTTFMINKEGRVHGYVPGMISKDIMKNIITQTLGE